MSARGRAAPRPSADPAALRTALRTVLRTALRPTLRTALLGAALLAAPAWAATPIDGRWTCHEQIDRNGLKGTLDSVTELNPDGTMRMVLAMNAYKLVVPVRVEASYTARWQYRDGKLHEQAESATITSFTIAGVDSRDSQHAADFRAEMLTPGTPPDVVILSENHIEFRQPGRVTSCTR